MKRIPFRLCVIFSLQLLLYRQAGGTCLASEHRHQDERSGVGLYACARVCVRERKREKMCTRVFCVT